MRTMFAIGRRDKANGFGMWHGPSPSEREMLNEYGAHFNDFIIRFDGDPSIGEKMVHQLLWRWNNILGEWKRYSPRVLHKKHDAQFIKDLGDKAVYIGRGSKWGNPFIVDRHGTRDEVITKYAEMLIGNISLLGAIEELAGKYLVCFCAPEACHGDVLIELANPIIEEAVDDWHFTKYLPDTEDFDVKGRECEKYLHAINKTREDFTEIDFFHAGFVRGLAWGIHKTTRHFDHLTRAQMDRYAYHTPFEKDDDDDIPF